MVEHRSPKSAVEGSIPSRRVILNTFYFKIKHKLSSFLYNFENYISFLKKYCLLPKLLIKNGKKNKSIC